RPLFRTRAMLPAGEPPAVPGTVQQPAKPASGDRRAITIRTVLVNQFKSKDRAALRERATELRARYDAIAARRLTLDMTRGKPCAEQLDLSLGMLEMRDYRAADGTDCRNYGVLEGLPEARRLF